MGSAEILVDFRKATNPVVAVYSFRRSRKVKSRGDTLQKNRAAIGAKKQGRFRMATYTVRPRSRPHAQKAWDVLAARYPAMQPTVLVSRLEDTRGWQWSMQFNSPDDKAEFWDSVSVDEIRELVAMKGEVKRTPASSGLRVVRKNPKLKK